MWNFWVESSATPGVVTNLRSADPLQCCTANYPRGGVFSVLVLHDEIVETQLVSSRVAPAFVSRRYSERDLKRSLK